MRAVEPRARGERLPGNRPRGLRQLREARLEQAKCLARFAFDSLAAGGQIGVGERFGRKRRVGSRAARTRDAAPRCGGRACGSAPGRRRARRAALRRRSRAAPRGSGRGNRACSPSRRPGSAHRPAAARASARLPSLPTYSSVPASGTQCGSRATSVRKRPISNSGLTPRRSRR